MFKFHNPLDPSKDGTDALIDGIRYNIRNSESIKEEILSNLNYFIYQARITNMDSPIDILENILKSSGSSLDELTISDEHELLDYISSLI